MNRNPFLVALAAALLTGVGLDVRAENAGAASSASNSADQGDNNYYWQGTQLYNLGRLGEAFESFEKAIQRKQNTKEAEAYLLQIRQEIVTNAKKRQEEKGALNYSGGNSPDAALNVAYVQKGFIRITLQARLLFDENSAALKTGAMDQLNRLVDILQSKEGQRIEVTLVNEMDNVFNVRDLDAERSLVVFSLINLKRLAQDSSTPS